MSTKKPADLQTIDLAALAQVSGGKARGSAASESGAGAAVMTALTGILDSLSSLAKNQNSSGMSSQDMMLIMMMMGSRSQGGVVAAQPAATNWTWDANGGYWIVK